MNSGVSYHGLPTHEKRDSAVLGTLHMLLWDLSPKLSIKIADSLCVLLSVGRNLQNFGPKNESQK